MIGCWVWGLAALNLLAEPLDRVGTLTDPSIREASGIVASRRHPGIFWVHNDSGNPPELFAVRLGGDLVRAYRVAAPNVDWEDIATDDSGNLYIADIGDNKLILPIHGIHQLREPDPFVEPDAHRPLTVVSSHYWRYPDRKPRDAEGMVVAGNQALIVTKRTDGLPAEVYRLPLDQPAALLRPLSATLVGILPGCVERVTGATLSRDGHRLAVVADGAVRVFAATAGGGWAPLGVATFQAREVEAITWDGESLILASEDRSLYRLAPVFWQATQRAPR